MKRYSIDGRFSEREDGGWVKYSDYEARVKELEAIIESRKSCDFCKHNGMDCVADTKEPCEDYESRYDSTTIVTTTGEGK